MGNMKIKSIEYNYKNKFIEFNILKSKIYKKITFLEFKNQTSHTKIHMKKILHLIHEFQSYNKKILFFNFPREIESILKNKRRKHIFTSNENFIKKIKSELKRLVDLIVVFNPNSDKFSYFFSIPTVIIQKNTTSDKSYRVAGYFEFVEKQTNNNLFLSLFKSVLLRKVLKKQRILEYQKKIEKKGFLKKKKKKKKKKK